LGGVVAGMGRRLFVQGVVSEIMTYIVALISENRKSIRAARRFRRSCAGWTGSGRRGRLALRV